MPKAELYTSYPGTRKTKYVSANPSVYDHIRDIPYDD